MARMTLQIGFQVKIEVERTRLPVLLNNEGISCFRACCISALPGSPIAFLELQTSCYQMSAMYGNQHITQTTVQSHRAQLETHHLSPPTGLGLPQPLLDLSSSPGRAEVPHFLSLQRGSSRGKHFLEEEVTLRAHSPVTRLLLAHQ